MTQKSSRKRLVSIIKDSPNFWWWNETQNNYWLIDGYGINFSFIGVMDDLDRCAVEIKKRVVRWLNSITDEEFEKYPGFRGSAGPVDFLFKVKSPGGPGTKPPPN